MSRPLSDAVHSSLWQVGLAWLAFCWASMMGGVTVSYCWGTPRFTLSCQVTGCSSCGGPARGCCGPRAPGLVATGLTWAGPAGLTVRPGLSWCVTICWPGSVPRTGPAPGTLVWSSNSPGLCPRLGSPGKLWIWSETLGLRCTGGFSGRII